MKQKIFIVVNVDRFFLSHRLPVALAAKDSGLDVTILTRDTGYRKEIESYGLHFEDIPFERSGSNPLHELKCVLILQQLYHSQKPDIIHHVTLKAALLGCLAAKLAGNKNVVNALSGFGYNFTNGRNGGLKQKIIRFAMNIAFRCKDFHFILQNPDDQRYVIEQNYTFPENVHLIKGSGIDLEHFSFQEETKKDKVRVILNARILYDKGVTEFVKAAAKIKNKVVDKAEFLLVGDSDMNNLAGIPEKAIVEMTDGDYIRWIGFQKDVFNTVRMADIVVLPSYREGLPKSLIEACAIGRPVITTDTIGCRECVTDGYNGFLVPVKDIDKLAEKMELLINDKTLRADMGKHSRRLAETNFSIVSVINKHLEIYRTMLPEHPHYGYVWYYWNEYTVFHIKQGA